MKKHKKKSFWGEDVDERSQMNNMDDLLRLTQIVESGGPIPNVDFKSVTDSAFDAELEAGLNDAITRLMNKANTGDMTDGFNPLERVKSGPGDIPEVDAIKMDDGPFSEIREMEEVKHDEPVEPPKQMVPKSFVKAEDVIEDIEDSEDDDLEYDEKPLEFSDFSIVSANYDWVFITNPYDMDQRISFSIFNLRGFNVEKNDMYNLMLKYLPIMFALLAGPALIVKQDNPIFKKFMRSSIDRGINVDKNKFMIFTVQNTEDAMYMVYLIDEYSRAGIFETFLPPIIERAEETDLFVQLAKLTLNPLINPYGMMETMWPGDRASEEISNDIKTEEFCNLMMKELGIEPVESSKTSYNAAISAFNKKSVIGDIQQFLKTINVAMEALEKQMTPDNYEEHFDKGYEEDTEDAVEDTVKEAPSPETHEESSAGDADGTDDLFDDVGDGVPMGESTAESETSKVEESSQEVASVEKKPSNKKFEIPVQR